MPAFYYYDPSLAASITFTVLFSLTALYHTYQLFRGKTWYFIPFLVGAAFQAVGYIIRTVSIQQKPNYELVPFILTTVLILLAPAVYAASIYMILGRLVELVEGEAYSLIRRKWLTKVFVLGDVLSFVVQGMGGSILTSAKTLDRINLGSDMIVGGLFIQIVFFSLFVVVIAVFHRRISRRPTPRSESLTVPWRRFIMILYVASTLILIRSIFRVVEYMQGREGELQSKEVYFYVFDATLMFIVSVLFNTYHPSKIIAPKEERPFPLTDV